ncbi:glycosyltransferase [Nitrosomonas sp. HPC101]|uniref:glycosyltransferase n=1 Tax=Nitrosomonas sp. HPC101 TaxID=1658667 RepID=UPI00136CDCCD|nr:glycosyltransferase [Nitrosomonas sp. HPC101]MXS86098.1 glycosyltransferase [Nitrosomonas sp. HPC101]
MLNIVDSPEKLWQECARLAKTPYVIASELYDDPTDHFVLAYGPVAQRNQFQSLLYSAQDQFNVSILPIHNLDLCGEIPWPGKVVCHFHWLHDKTKNAKTEAEANEAVAYWERLLCRIKENGHKIVWTVHNVMPHEAVWVEQDKKIHQMMADAADALHVMASDSAKLTEPYYQLDERKIFLVPHPTYQGAQPDDISRGEARSHLKISEEEFVFLSFGAIMEYKGYDWLMAAYDQLRDKAVKKTRLIIAGLPSDKALVERINRWGRTKADVILDMVPVPNEKLQIYFRAADVAVCPYRRTMNSGAAFMALTFELPVIGPNSGGFADLIRDGCAFGYNINYQGQLGVLMKNIIKVDFSTIKNSLMIQRDNFSPLLVSRSFFNNILNLNRRS